jgi:hypothetical protein
MLIMELVMKRIIFIFIIALANPLWGAKPIVTVPDLPQSSELEIYTESEGIFTMKLLEYYNMAVVLESQLKFLGIVPQSKSIQPIYEEFEDLDEKILRKYHKIAKALENEVLNAPESERQLLLEKINDLEGKLLDTVAIYTIEKGATRNEVLDKMVKRLKEIEETNKKNLELVINQNFVNCIDYKTWFAIAGVTKTFFSQGNDVITNDPGIGVQLSMNIGKLMGFWDGFEFRYEYFAPKFYTNYNTNNVIRPREQWNTNLNSINGGSKIEINRNERFIHGLNLFIGYFWANGNIYNKSDGRMNYDGGTMSIEYYLSSPSCKFPIEIFAGISIYNSFSRNLVFYTNVPGYSENDIGKTHLSANIGIRYNLWRTPF